jgi:glutamine cyclotransferase
MKFAFRFFSYSLLSVLFYACNGSQEAENNNESAIAAPTSLQYEIVKVYPHDTSSYTQGLEWDGNKLIEGTGLEGKSILHLLDTNQKEIGNKVKLAKDVFGEGTTLFNGKIYQLTWTSHKVFVYDAKTLVKEKEFYWPYEGWGLTHNDTSLIVSTGESNIYLVSPSTFAIQKTIGVYNNLGYVNNINELEYVNGKLYANIYGRNSIVVINLSTGQVFHTIDFSNLLAQSGVKYDPQSIDAGYVLNGIAYQPKSNTFFITGKCWPVLVEMKIK